MRIPMKTIGGERVTFYVDAEPTDTVGVLKAKVRDKLRGLLYTDLIQLIYGGEWLADARKLSEVGIDGRFFVGVEILSRPGHLSVTIPGGTKKQTAQRSTSLHGVTGSLQVVEREPVFEDDVFDMFRFLTQKYYRWRGKKRAPKETRRYKTKWSLDKTNLTDVDTLAEMGFGRAIVLQVYLACDKKVNAAANVLLQG